MKMTMKGSMAMLLALGLLGASPVFADDETMIVVDEEDTAEEVMNVIALPEGASETGVERSADGLDTANRAREDGRAYGEQRAEDARARGQEARESAGESARDQARERAGSAGGPPEGVPAP